MDSHEAESLALIAHEMRTPLTVIAGCAAQLRERWEAMEEADKLEALDSIVRNVHNLQRLIEVDLQDRLEGRDDVDCQSETIDLAELVQHVVRDFARTCPERRFVLHIEEAIPPVEGDRWRNEQVLVNLLSNAVKFSASQDPVEVRVSSQGDMAQVEVHDIGIGLASDETPDAFRKFARAKGALEFGVPGDGLGLYHAKRVVEGQGGEIWIEPRRGRGTTVAYTLPLGG